MTEATGKISDYKMLNTFLGTTDIPDLVVLTPLGHIYEETMRRIYVKERRNCWWRNYTGKTENNKEIMVVKAPSGSAIVDSILSVSEMCNYLLFLGFCGGLHHLMELGDITIATRSYFENDENFYEPKFRLSAIKSVFPHSIPGTNLTVESVIKEDDAIKSGKPGYLKPNTVSVDMETAFLYRESMCPSVSVMVVSDLPKSKTLFDLETDEREEIRAGTSRLVEGILELANLL